MNHWKPNENNTNPNLAFCVNVLFSVMAHDCDCAGCTMAKGHAVRSLNWLIGDKMSIPEALHLGTSDKRPEERLLAHIFGEEEQGEEDDGYDVVPEEVINACQRAISAHDTTDAEKGIIAGWLESLG